MRLADNPALCAAVAAGGPVLPVFILDEVTDSYGALPRWRMGLGAGHLDRSLRALGSRLVLRRGPALDVLRHLAGQTGARMVVWSRLVDPDARARDEAVKAGLRADGLAPRSFPGHFLWDPWTVQTASGGFYRVFTPFWRAVKDRDPGTSLAPPGRLPAPETWPDSDRLDDWALDQPMRRGAGVVRPHLGIGEAVARDRLDRFLTERAADYAEARDMLAQAGTSELSENLTHGEISPRQCWLAAQEAARHGVRGAETFLRELVWREFAHHLAYHTPHLTSANWRPEWDAFPWSSDAIRPEIRAWQQGRTGVELVDAAMRELYVTGTMHNRGRMIVASYLCKHLMGHWKIGQAWFADCLRDWDPASNAMGWQWVAGSGPDAAPYFRIFNPDTQRAKFDPDRAYVRRWIAEGQRSPPDTARAYFEAIPQSWALWPSAPYPAPVVALAEGRARALEAYQGHRA